MGMTAPESLMLACLAAAAVGIVYLAWITIQDWREERRGRR